MFHLILIIKVDFPMNIDWNSGYQEVIKLMSTYSDIPLVIRQALLMRMMWVRDIILMVFTSASHYLRSYLSCWTIVCKHYTKWDMLMSKAAFSLVININQSACRPLDWGSNSQVLYMHHWEIPIQQKIIPTLTCPNIIKVLLVRACSLDEWSKP